MSGENEADCPARVLGWREQTHRWHKRDLAGHTAAALQPRH